MQINYIYTRFAPTCMNLHLVPSLRDKLAQNERVWEQSDGNV